MNNLTIRLETQADYRAVEELTREAFWNVYKPGADEHYFVHMMRSHPDFIPELAFVLEMGGEIVGAIMYTKAWLEDCESNYPTALLVAELVPGALDGKKWMYVPSTAADCCEDTAAVEAFDATFPEKEKKWMPSQEEFYIYSHSSVVR